MIFFFVFFLLETEFGKKEFYGVYSAVRTINGGDTPRGCCVRSSFALKSFENSLVRFGYLRDNRIFFPVCIELLLTMIIKRGQIDANKCTNFMIQIAVTT